MSEPHQPTMRPFLCSHTLPMCTITPKVLKNTPKVFFVTLGVFFVSFGQAYLITLLVCLVPSLRVTTFISNPLVSAGT